MIVGMSKTEVHSNFKKINEKTPDRRLTLGIRVPSRAKSTLNMTKHPGHRSTENCLLGKRLCF